VRRTIDGLEEAVPRIQVVRAVRGSIQLEELANRPVVVLS
jgi:hypothetical protein